MLGPPGAGKSSALRSLARDMNEHTLFINSERKAPPFPEEFKTQISPKTTREIFDAYEEMIATGKKNGIAVVALDSFSGFCEIALYEARLTFTQWDIWADYNEKIGKLMRLQKDLNDEGIHSVMIAHDEILLDENGSMSKVRAKVKGKEWEGLVEKEFNVCLWTEPVVSDLDPNKYNYMFLTNKYKNLPAKSAIELLDKYIPNDIALVIKALDNYGKKPNKPTK